jgi:hypothetical protein
MDKVKITQKQADAIKQARTEMSNEFILSAHRSPTLWVGEYKPLNDMTNSQLIGSLEDNFEVTL